MTSGYSAISIHDSACVILSDLLQNLNLALQHVSLIVELLHELLVSANQQSDISIYKKFQSKQRTFHSS